MYELLEFFVTKQVKDQSHTPQKESLHNSSLDLSWHPKIFLSLPVYDNLSDISVFLSATC